MHHLLRQGSEEAQHLPEGALKAWVTQSDTQHELSCVSPPPIQAHPQPHHAAGRNLESR